MRQLNFLLIFALCLVIVLFSIENTDPVVIHLAKGIDLQAPLAIELLAAGGLGAVLAWFFSVWSRLQSYLASRQMVRSRDRRIQELESDVQVYKQNLEQFKASLEESQRFLPGVDEPESAAPTGLAGSAS
ncbi:MAG: LapA family protein [Synechococcales bacterium]|nr:LapA family protein [Synechococcales bacterium]